MHLEGKVVWRTTGPCVVGVLFPSRRGGSTQGVGALHTRGRSNGRSQNRQSGGVWVLDQGLGGHATSAVPTGHQP